MLYTGRLSFHAKAHPLAMYQALEKAAQGLPAGQKVVLVECGWHANDFIAKAYREAAQLACPSVRVVTLDGRKAQDRQTAWAGADRKPLALCRSRRWPQACPWWWPNGTATRTLCAIASMATAFPR